MRDNDSSSKTNPLAEKAGYPATLEDGLIVSIVDKARDASGREILTDSKGNKYVTHESYGHVVPLDEAEPATSKGDVTGDYGTAPAPYPDFDPTHGPTDPDPATAPTPLP